MNVFKFIRSVFGAKEPPFFESYKPIVEEVVEVVEVVEVKETPNRDLTLSQIVVLANENGFEPAALDSVIRTESSGRGFSDKTGRLIIQFEPSWFKRKYSAWKRYSFGRTWVNNGVRNQTIEWEAFNDAFSISPNAAMESTSVGMMQVMGFHWKLLGFRSVGEMWDYAKESEANQVDLGIRFIKSNRKLNEALFNKDWATFAYYYNGRDYKKFKYDTRLQANYKVSLQFFNKSGVH